MSSCERIANELKGLGYEPFFIDSPQGRTTVISYKIPTGKHNREKVFLGFSFQEEGYPEYPPHWIHISPPYDDQLGGAFEFYQHKDSQGIERPWRALSRPPTDIWDGLATKHMRHYLDYHITRFCKELK